MSRYIRISPSHMFGATEGDKVLGGVKVIYSPKDLNLVGAQVGQEIYKRVGTVKKRPIIEKKVVPFEIGKEYLSNNNVPRTYLGAFGDTAFWQYKQGNIAFMTRADGSAIEAGGISYRQEEKEVVIGTELYIEEDKE